MSAAAAMMPPNGEGANDRALSFFSGSEELNLEEGLPERTKQLLAALDPADAAPSLFSDDLIDGAAAKAGNHFTARYLRERQPRVYRACVALVAGGYSLREVSELLRVSKNTVAAVIDDAPELLGTLKQRTARLLRRLGLKLAERLDEEVDNIPIGQLAVTLGIATDKAQLLEGEATAIVEQRTSPQHADWAATLAELEQEYGLPAAEPIKRADASIVEDVATAHLESTDSAPSASDSPGTATAFATPHGATSRDPEPLPGGEGVRPAATPEPPERSESDGISSKGQFSPEQP